MRICYFRIKIFIKLYLIINKGYLFLWYLNIGYVYCTYINDIEKLERGKKGRKCFNL